MRSAARTSSFGLIGAGFGVAVLVSACGGSSGTAASATSPAASSVVATSAVPTSSVASPASPTMSMSMPATTEPPTTKAPTTQPRTISASPKLLATTKPPATTPPTTTPPTTTKPPTKPTTTRPTTRPTTVKPTTTSPRPTVTKPSVVTAVVTETEFSISLSRKSYAAGTVAFLVHNTGSTTHAFAVSGPGVDGSTDDLAPGSSATLTVTLAKGSYDLYCPIANHQAMGMDVHVTVS
jgi:plastocyanin